MKQYWFLALAGLLASCQGHSNPELLAVDYRLATPPARQVRKPRPAAACALDTAAILTNANLDALLRQASREELKEPASIKGIPAAVLSYLDCLAGGKFSIAETYFLDFNDEEDSAVRRLKYLGVGNTITLLAYEAGSVCFTSRKVIIIRRNERGVQDLWLGPADYQAADKNSIINSIYADQHQAPVKERITSINKYILDKNNKTTSNAEKREFIRAAFQYELSI